MEDFDNRIYGIVKELQQAVQAEGRSPASASMHQITARVADEVKQSLNRLVKDGRLSWYPNLNKVPMFTTKD